MEDFNAFEKRLSSLDESVRADALKLAAQFYANEECTREEALEKGIAQAELQKRNL